MPAPVIYAQNLLEGAILTLLPDGHATGKGPERLIDRDVGLECEDSGTTGTRIWHADRGLGAASPTVHAWLFVGSNYAETVMTLETSPDNTTWTVRETRTPTSDAPQYVVLASPFAVPRYVRWTVASPTAPVRFTEVFLAVGGEFAFLPTARDTQEPLLPNVVVLTSQSGRAWGVQRGARRWSTRYTLSVAPAADRTRLFELLDAIQDGVLPFFFSDVHGDFHWVRLAGAITLGAADGLPSTHWTIPLELIEELP